MDIHQALRHIKSTLPSNIEIVNDATLSSVKSDKSVTKCTYKTSNSSEKVEARMFINAAGQ